MRFFRPLLRSLFITPHVPDEPARTIPPGEFSGAVRRALRAPLVVGASVSAEYATKSPARRAMGILGIEDRALTKFAKFGARAKALLPLVNYELVQRHTAVIATDVVFWDTLSWNAASTVAALQDFGARIDELAIPVVLGTAPLLKNHWFQPGLKQVNAAVREACETFENFHLLDLERIYETIRSQNGFSIGGRYYSVADVAPDALHLSNAACEFVAYEIIGVLEQALPALRHSYYL
ncbi:MAG TPA: hypothetical protein VFV50_07050 [Bdellovibrionales bacterium]|nr:hypothetical protein [Bdellovibrionales bacterium]